MLIIQLFSWTLAKERNESMLHPFLIRTVAIFHQYSDPFWLEILSVQRSSMSTVGPEESIFYGCHSITGWCNQFSGFKDSNFDLAVLIHMDVDRLIPVAKHLWKMVMVHSWFISRLSECFHSRQQKICWFPAVTLVNVFLCSWTSLPLISSRPHWQAPMYDMAICWVFEGTYLPYLK